MSGRKPFVGGNWKLSIRTLIDELNTLERTETEVVVAPPAIYLSTVKQLTQNGPLIVAAQNCWKSDKGAFTGETSFAMLKDLDVNWVILGHSERRQIFGETSELIGEKTVAALNAGLSVIFCCGETLEERENKQIEKVLFSQLGVLAFLTQLVGKVDWSRIVIAYEPVWAIGTGKVASPEQAQDAHRIIREWLASNSNAQTASATRIIYGGSVSPKNSAELGALPDVDGFLVGGASLIGAQFKDIVTSLRKESKL